MLHSDSHPQSLLAADEPAPARLYRPQGQASFLLIADHAGRRVPRALGQLGLEASAFDLHIAWDIGIEGVMAHLSDLLDATAIAQVYSRLVIDCNRAPDSPRAIVEVSDGVAIAGNSNLDSAQRRARAVEIHAPYQKAIAAHLDGKQRRLLVALHSFTPQMNGFVRPWQCGILHLHNSKMSDAMLRLLQAEPDLVVGDNEPYAMEGTDYTVPAHAIARGLDYVEIEIRQDLIASADGQRAWAARLARLLPQALALSEG